MKNLFQICEAAYNIIELQIVDTIALDSNGNIQRGMHYFSLVIFNIWKKLFNQNPWRKN